MDDSNLRTALLRVVQTEQDVEGGPVDLPSGYLSSAHGIYEVGADGKRSWVCSPIRISGLTRDAHGAGWGKCIELQDADGRWHTVSVSARLFAGDGVELRELLLERGLRLEPGGCARRKLMSLLMRWNPIDRVLAARRLGWTDETCEHFLFGDGRCLGPEKVVFQPDTPRPMCQTAAVGSIEDWRSSVASLCRANPILLLSVSLAFAGPLLEPLGLEGGGIHLVGQSSRGKTTALRAAVSVWGPPGLLSSWHATVNGLETIAAASNATILALDEIGQVDARDASAAAYALANGIGKTRSTQRIQLRPPLTWRTLVLSSGELSLGSKIEESGRPAAAGQEVRLIDVRADRRSYGAFDCLHGHGDPASLSDAIRDASRKHYGTAGHAFVERVVGKRDDAFAQVGALIARFRSTALPAKAEVDGQVGRALGRFALIAAGGELATSFGITGWEPGEATDAARLCFDTWLDERGGTQAAEVRAVVQRTRDFLVRFGASRFDDLRDDSGSDYGSVRGERAGWRDEACYYISPGSWKEIHDGFDPRRAAEILRDESYLIPGEGKDLRVRPRSIRERPRVFQVRAEILGAA